MRDSRYSESIFGDRVWFLFISLLLSHSYSLRTVVLAALLLISIGNGNLRACITTLGGRQFTLPEQKQNLERYFSHYYFFYTLGILLSKIVPPAVRTETQCFGKPDCYLAVFGLLGALFLASWSKTTLLTILKTVLLNVLLISVVFLSGLQFYKPERPSYENILFQVIGKNSFVWSKRTLLLRLE
jgi:dipeptide/tripeptide permease